MPISHVSTVIQKENKKERNEVLLNSKFFWPEEVRFFEEVSRTLLDMKSYLLTKQSY